MNEDDDTEKLCQAVKFLSYDQQAKLMLVLAKERMAHRRMNEDDAKLVDEEVEREQIEKRVLLVKHMTRAEQIRFFQVLVEELNGA